MEDKESKRKESLEGGIIYFVTILEGVSNSMSYR
jgi:hypothetical protein